MASKSYFTLLVLLGVAFALTACALPSGTNQTNATLPDFSTVTPVTPVETTEGSETETEGDFALTLTYTEGDLIELKTVAVSPDDVPVDLEFPTPFNNDGEWQTAIGDAGDYPVTIVARDTRGLETEARLLVRILLANRAPELDGPESVTVDEGDTITLSYTASDVDGDETVISFSGWMKSEQYTTTYDDAGSYEVTVTASDGKTTTRKTVPITVENMNRAPVFMITRQNRIATELEEFRIEGVTAQDPDGDAVTLSYSRPLDNNGRWVPQYDDAGSYEVEVVATDSDGMSATETVSFEILAANRPPKIVVPTEDGTLRFKEGDMIDLREALEITDDSNSDVVVTYSGWMSRSTYQTTYDDAGSHGVTVTAEDETELRSSLTVTIIVEDVNRPPVFVRVA